MTRILVPVNFALNWSNPYAEIPLTGQSTQKAETGGWCEVCSVMYETRTGFPVVSTVLPVSMALLADSFCPLPIIVGALSSTSQLH